MHALHLGIYLGTIRLLENLLQERKLMNRTSYPRSGIKVKINRELKLSLIMIFYSVFVHFEEVLPAFFDVQQSSTMQYTEA